MQSLPWYQIAEDVGTVVDEEVVLNAHIVKGQVTLKRLVTLFMGFLENLSIFQRLKCMIRNSQDDYRVSPTKADKQSQVSTVTGTSRAYISQSGNTQNPWIIDLGAFDQIAGISSFLPGFVS